MVKKIAVGAVLGGLAAFIWGAFFWMALPFGDMIITQPEDETSLLDRLRTSLPETGVYFLPDLREDPSDQDYPHRFQRGPVVQIFYRYPGVPYQSLWMFAAGYVHLVVSAGLMGILLAWAGPRLPKYGDRLKFVILVGVMIAFYANLLNPIWFHHPLDYHLMVSIDTICTWTAIGAVLAQVVQPAGESGEV